MSFESELVDNYRALKESRGWTWAQMADHVKAFDASLAEHLRGFASEDKSARAAKSDGKAVAAAPEKR